MDIVSHGAWAALAARAINRKKAEKEPGKTALSIWRAAFWGVLPDLFAFTIPLAGLLWHWTFAGVDLADLPGPSSAEPPLRDTLWVFGLASSLYNISHSIAVFGFVCAALLAFRMLRRVASRPPWEMGAWLLHIIMDVFTHSYDFYPTPVFWPLADWKFNGFSWGTPWFLAVNYSALVAAFFLLRERPGKRNEERRHSHSEADGI